MAAPIVYRWDDGNAPVARGERRSLCDILYACLVTGYGTKPGAGWTREFVNATFDKAVFRNNPVTGTGFFLQIDGLGGANEYTPKIQAYEVMTSESDGLFPFHASTTYTQVSNMGGTTARPWILVADDRAFYLIIWVSITSTPTVADTATFGMSFGDFVKWKPDDAYACGLMAQYGPVSNTAQASDVTGAVSEVKIPRKSSGAVGSSYIGATIHGGGPCNPGIPGSTGLAYTSGDPFLYNRPYINDGAAYTLRGWSPGLYIPCHPHPFSQFQSISVDGKNFIAFKARASNSSTASFMLSLDDWRA